MSIQRYAMLVEPSVNRVYTATAPRMLAAELAVVDACLLEGDVGELRHELVAGVLYLGFDGSGLTDRDLRVLANLSGCYALFERHGELLRPVQLRRLDRYDDDLLTILKYPGKTNEQFTKLLLNVTAAAAGSADRVLDARLRVLDPMCGRGTTLNQAIMYGWDAYGIDVDKRDVDAYGVFIRRWLESKRMKHSVQESRLRRDGQTLGRRLTVEFAASKAEYKAGVLQRLDVAAADTLRAGEIHAGGSFDLIVTDAPYGVQHGAVERGAGGRGAAQSRRPTALLEEAVPVWARLLRRRGAMGISWNTRLTPREHLAGILAGAGLEVLEVAEPHDFAHRVDQAIDRDVIVARR